MSSYKKWIKEEIELLRELWWNLPPNEIVMEGRSASTLESCAHRHNMKHSPECLDRINRKRQEMLTKRNKTVLGRDITYELAKNEAKKYNSRQEFREKDLTLYVYVRNNELFDELCPHMVHGASFNYSQRFLYHVIGEVLKTELRYNDRVAIKPREIDIYCPVLKIGFELDGSNFHNTEESAKRDEEKDKECAYKGITLYRIAEVREERHSPENYILRALSDFGFDVSCINVEAIKSKTYSEHISDKTIRETVSKYTTLLDFRTNESSLYHLLLKKRLHSKYLSGLERAKTTYTDEIICEVIGKCDFKKDFYTRFKNEYLAFSRARVKFPKALTLYKDLPSSR